MARSYDITLFGATGFTGRLLAQRLAEAGQHGLSWALAGRDEVRLRALADLLGGGAGVVLADAHDPHALAKLAADTRVVLSAAGPFARLGSELVAAAVAQGAHYVDVSGEVPWVRRIIDSHHEEARAAGLRIVPCCGFDAVPSDLSASFMARALRERGSQPRTIEVLYTLRGSVPGGTMATLRELWADPRARAQLDDPRLLNPAGARGVRAEERDLAWPRWHRPSQRWMSPFLLSRVHTRVVRRSIALAGPDSPYGDDLIYREGLRTPTRRQALALTAAQAALTTALRSRRGRSVLRRVLPSAGAGADDVQRRSGFVSAALFARGHDGTELRGSLSTPGDPATAATAVYATEAALCLLDEAPLPDAAGVLTPALAMGEALEERLRAAGTTLDLRTA